MNLYEPGFEIPTSEVRSRNILIVDMATMSEMTAS